MSRNGIQTCPRCGRVLMGLEPCPNCVAASYASETARTYGITSESHAPRWLLLAGALLLLTLLFFAVTQRNNTSMVLPSGTTPPVYTPSVAPSVAVTTRSQPVPAVASSEDDKAFWRRKAERDLREAGTRELTEAEKAYRDQMHIWNFFSTTNETRTADYYMRRPEVVGRR